MSLTQMQNYFPVGNECSQYQTVLASQTTAAIGNKSTGSVGDYIEAIVCVPGTSAAAAWTLFDGTTAVFAAPAQAGQGVAPPYTIPLGIRATARFNITTGANVSVVVIGSFK